MLNKVVVVLILIVGIVFIWLLMSAIYYLFIFVKAFIQSFNRIDTTQQSQFISSPEMELKSEQPDNELKTNFSLERINEWQSIDALDDSMKNVIETGNGKNVQMFFLLEKNAIKTGDSKDVQMVFMLEKNVICVPFRNSTKSCMKVLEDADIPVNKTKPDIQSRRIKWPIPYSNAGELAPYFAQN